jgi:hypothetical protein
MALAANAVCTVLEAKDWINIPAAIPTYDLLITDLINVVSLYIEGKLNRLVKQQGTAAAEAFDGDGTNVHFVKYPPMVRPTVITIEGETAVTVASTDEVRYDLDAGKIMLIGRVFSTGYPNNCSVTYQGGWATIPYDIWQGCRELVKRLYKARDRQNEGVASTSSGLTGQTVTYRPDEVMDEEIWDKYFKRYELKRYA